MPAARKPKAPAKKPVKAAPSSSGGKTQASIYSNLVKKGMSPKQAAAFSKHAAKRTKKPSTSKPKGKSHGKK